MEGVEVPSGAAGAVPKALLTASAAQLPAHKRKRLTVRPLMMRGDDAGPLGVCGVMKASHLQASWGVRCDESGISFWLILFDVIRASKTVFRAAAPAYFLYFLEQQPLAAPSIARCSSPARTLSTPVSLRDASYESRTKCIQTDDPRAARTLSTPVSLRDASYESRTKCIQTDDPRAPAVPQEVARDTSGAPIMPIILGPSHKVRAKPK
eukprot:594040-Prorocentrum_minimum.AAC.1